MPSNCGMSNPNGVDAGGGGGGFQKLIAAPKSTSSAAAVPWLSKRAVIKRRSRRSSSSSKSELSVLDRRRLLGQLYQPAISDNGKFCQLRPRVNSSERGKSDGL